MRPGSTLIGLSLFAVAASCAVAQELEIDSFRHNGSLSWTHSGTTGSYRVEWSPAPTGTWQQTWQHLTRLPAGGTNITVEVPMFYRVVWEHGTSTPVTVVNELVATGDGTSTNFQGFLDNPNVVPGSLSIQGGSAFFTDDTTGFLNTVDARFGMTVYDTGAWYIEMGTEVLGNGTPIRATYQYRPPDPRKALVTDENVGSGDGGGIYTGHFGNAPLEPGTVSLSPGPYFLKDDGSGFLGGFGIHGTVVYSTGAWHVDVTPRAVSPGAFIRAGYLHTAHHPSIAMVRDENLATGDGGTSYSGVLAESPNPGTLSIRAGNWFLSDDGHGTLTGSGGKVGAVVYSTGAWNIVLTPDTLPNGTPVLASYLWIP